jgi:hypothetical protein
MLIPSIDQGSSHLCGAIVLGLGVLVMVAINPSCAPFSLVLVLISIGSAD